MPEEISERRRKLPSLDVVDQALCEYQVAAATREDVVWAAGLGEKVYSGFDVIPEDVMLDWFEVNPRGFSVLKCGGERVGNLDILPVKRHSLARLVTGKLLERDLTGDSLYSDDERGAIDTLYIESLVVDPDFQGSSPRMVVELIASFESVVARICEPAQVKSIYAIAASDEGASLLMRLGFEPVGTPDGRKDAHQLYLGSMQAVVGKVEQLVGRRSRVVEVKPVVEVVAPSDPRLGLAPELASVLFADIVGFTKLDPAAQLDARRELERVVGESAAFMKARREGRVIARSTGDGMALVFFAHPVVAAECAVDVAKMLRGTFGLRMGINEGTVYRVKDINGTDDVNGSGINMAQRVMDAGNEGHILISAAAAEDLKGTMEWCECVHAVGMRRIKHGDRIEIFNLWGEGFGNSAVPFGLGKAKAAWGRWVLGGL